MSDTGRERRKEYMKNYFYHKRKRLLHHVTNFANLTSFYLKVFAYASKFLSSEIFLIWKI